MEDFLTEEIPKPLEALTVSRIDPENQAIIEARLARLRPMEKHQLRASEKRIKEVINALNRANYNELKSFQQHCEAELTEIILALNDLKGQLQLQDEAIDRAAVAQEINRLKELGKLAQQRRRNVLRQLEPLEPLFEEFQQLNKALENHYQILVDLEANELEEKQFEKEAKHYCKLVKEEFKYNPRCHHVFYDKRGRRRVKVPKIERVWFSPYTIWIKIATSRQGLWNTWKRLLPYDVDIRGLIDDDTIQNMTAVVGRQVEYEFSDDRTALYYKINRLDAPGGLPRFFTFEAMFQKYPTRKHKYVPFPAGVKKGGKLFWLDFSKQPHVLVAGETRSGKSNFVNCMISTMIQTHSPKDLRLILIDNKGGVEFSFYRNVPHLLVPVVRQINDVIPALETVRRIMYQRLDILRETDAKDIISLNEKVGPENHMPRLVVFIDEMASLKGQSFTKEIHQLIQVIAAMGAATGIHIILATQYPGRAITPPEVKANVATRVVFQMTSGGASMTALDSHVAKDLPDTKGRAMIKEDAKPIEVQTPFISDEQVRAAVEAAMKFGAAPVIEMPALAEGDTDQVETVNDLTLEDEEDETVEAAPVAKASTRKLTQAELIRIAIEELDGNLGANPIWKHCTDKYQNASLPKIKAMVKEIIELEQVEFGGQVYLVAPNGKGFALRELNLNEEKEENEAVATV